MPNELYFDSTGKAVIFYKSLDKEHREKLDVVFDYLRENPEPDGENKIAILRPPIVIYYYNDGVWKISYALGFLPKNGIFRIDISTIGFA